MVNRNEIPTSLCQDFVLDRYFKGMDIEQIRREYKAMPDELYDFHTPEDHIRDYEDAVKAYEEALKNGE